MYAFAAYAFKSYAFANSAQAGGGGGPTPPTLNYGLTAGPALGGADGLTLIKANGLGTGALQGIPQDAP